MAKTELQREFAEILQALKDLQKQFLHRQRRSRSRSRSRAVYDAVTRSLSHKRSADREEDCFDNKDRRLVDAIDKYMITIRERRRQGEELWPDVFWIGDRDVIRELGKYLDYFKLSLQDKEFPSGWRKKLPEDIHTQLDLTALCLFKNTIESLDKYFNRLRVSQPLTSPGVSTDEPWSPQSRRSISRGRSRSMSRGRSVIDSDSDSDVEGLVDGLERAQRLRLSSRHGKLSLCDDLRRLDIQDDARRRSDSHVRYGARATDETAAFTSRYKHDEQFRQRPSSMGNVQLYSNGAYRHNQTSPTATHSSRDKSRGKPHSRKSSSRKYRHEEPLSYHASASQQSAMPPADHGHGHSSRRRSHQSQNTTQELPRGRRRSHTHRRPSPTYDNRYDDYDDDYSADYYVHGRSYHHHRSTSPYDQGLYQAYDDAPHSYYNHRSNYHHARELHRYPDSPYEEEVRYELPA
ncbi:hypothetical protein KEM56_007448 [Ascosphaera pollenicola]|nr:hypothetical protein KEM56_007448 [Ascosphaera pollenicola]